MRTIQYHEHGGHDVLQMETIEPPTPSNREVLVRVEATSVNPLDVHLREGTYEPPTLPMIPGVDFAGRIESVGDDVEKYATGDRVYGTGLGFDRMGANAEYAVSPVDRIAHLPESIPFEIGGAVGNVAVPSWRALIEYGDLSPGDTCLIHGGNGGVGHIAVQLAQLSGAQVITTATPTYHEDLHDLGADTVLDYHRDDLESAVNAATDENGVDVILDHMLDEYLQFDVNVAAPYGRIVAIGGMQGTITDAALARIKDIRLQIMSLFNVPDIAGILTRLTTFIDAGDITPAIAQTFSLSDTPAAQRTLSEESFLGKLVIKP